MSARYPHLARAARAMLDALDQVGDLSAPSPMERAAVERAGVELRSAVTEAEDAADMATQMARILGRDARRGIRRRKR